MKDRLIDLIKQAKKQTHKAKCDIERNMIFADHLIDNGVIVLPCKVGDTVYVVDKGLDVWWKGEVSSVGAVDQNNIQIGVIYDDGEVAICDADTVFLNKEEADELSRRRGIPLDIDIE